MATSTIQSTGWKLAGTATGTNTVTMPTEYNEILLLAYRATTYLSIVVPKAEISSTSIYPRSGFYYRSDINDGAYFEVNSSTANLGRWYANNGAEVSSQVTFKLYYR